jgi:hypothetical protein
MVKIVTNRKEQGVTRYISGCNSDEQEGASRHETQLGWYGSIHAPGASHGSDGGVLGSGSGVEEARGCVPIDCAKRAAAARKDPT